MTIPVTMTAALVYHCKDEKRGEEIPILVGEEDKNYLDHLPDELLLLILNKILDARSLCRCTSLSKRFASLVPQVDSVSVLATVPNISTTLCPTTAKKKPASKWTRYLLKKLVHNFFTKPLEFFQPFSIELVRPETSRSASSSNNNAKIGPAELTKWISNSLKNFFAVQSLRLELPAGGGVVGFPDNVPLLRWTAEFGTELESCAIIAAASVEEKKDKDDDEDKDKENEDDKKFSPPEQGNETTDNNTTPNNAPNSDPNQPLLSDADLKSRVVWILSCLIAAGARHGLVRQMVLDCPNLRSAEIVDSGKQGKLSMNEEQIKALRDSISPKDDEKTTDGDAASASDPIWKRSAIPNLILKLWYVPELELKGSGRIMKGATVVIVKPDERRRAGAPAAASECAGQVEKENHEAAEASLGRGFCEDQDEGIGEAAKEIMRSKWKLMYKMEMNSF